MNSLEDIVSQRLRATAERVHAPWDAAAPLVQRRARRRARQRTARRTGGIAAVAAVTLAATAAVTRHPHSDAGLGAVVTTIPATSAPVTTPRYGLASWTLARTDRNTSAAAPSTLTVATYRQPGRLGAADPYVLVVAGTAQEYSVGDNGVMRTEHDHRAIGWETDGRVLAVSSFGVTEGDLRALADRFRAIDGSPLPDTLGPWAKRAERPWSAAGRYDELQYVDGDARVEFHNQTGVDVAQLLDDRLAQYRASRAIAVAGHDAILVDVSNETSTRFWVLWHEADGVVELDIEGLPEDRLDGVLAAVVPLDTTAYDALFPPAR